MSLLETFLGRGESIPSARKEPRTRISELPDGFAYLTSYLLRRTSDSALTYPPASSHHFIDSRDEWHGRGSFPPALRCRSVVVDRPPLRSASIRRKISRETQGGTF